MTDTIATLLAAHAAGKPLTATIEETYDRIERHDDPALFIALRPKAEALAEAQRAAGGRARRQAALRRSVRRQGQYRRRRPADDRGLSRLRLYARGSSAFVVERLERAGAIVIGKTNLDQFATGLVGVRSPYGVPRNALRADLIPGGSSSGSAAAVGAGLVPFSLGTDTAGSGRVPAALNGIVGLKPSLGALSASGVVPACRTLDTISVFALDVADAFAVFRGGLRLRRGGRLRRARSRRRRCRRWPGGLRLGVPARRSARVLRRQRTAEAAFARDVAAAEALGARIVEFDFEPFAEVARLLYEGPWVAERYAATKPLIESNPERAPSGDARDHRGGAQVRRGRGVRGVLPARGLRTPEAGPCLAGVRRRCSVPTIPRPYTVAEVEADPVRLNSRLGTYTNFVNLLDLCADRGALGHARRRAAVERDADRARRRRRPRSPASPPRSRRAPARRWARPASVRRSAAPVRAPRPAASRSRWSARISPACRSIASSSSSARAFSREGGDDERTIACYALPGSEPPKPGLLRVGDGAGAAIKAELWTLDPAGFGAFVARIPAPLGIGTIRLNDGGSSARDFWSRRRRSRAPKTSRGSAAGEPTSAPAELLSYCDDRLGGSMQINHVVEKYTPRATRIVAARPRAPPMVLDGGERTDEPLPVGSALGGGPLGDCCRQTAPLHSAA